MISWKRDNIFLTKLCFAAPLTWTVSWLSGFFRWSWHNRPAEFDGCDSFFVEKSQVQFLRHQLRCHFGRAKHPWTTADCHVRGIIELAKTEPKMDPATFLPYLFLQIGRSHWQHSCVAKGQARQASVAAFEYTFFVHGWWKHARFMLPDCDFQFILSMTTSCPVLIIRCIRGTWTYSLYSVS